MNSVEAQRILNLVGDIIRGGELGLTDIGVVTPYSAQVRRLRQMVRQVCPSHLDVRNLEIASVDAFQGREKELMIFSAVRCNPRGNMGFLADWRRLNVMLTRARRGLVVFGSGTTLCADPTWRRWLKWCDRQGAIHGGADSIAGLRQALGGKAPEAGQMQTVQQFSYQPQAAVQVPPPINVVTPRPLVIGQPRGLSIPPPSQGVSVPPPSQGVSVPPPTVRVVRQPPPSSRQPLIIQASTTAPTSTESTAPRVVLINPRGQVNTPQGVASVDAASGSRALHQASASASDSRALHQASAGANDSRKQSKSRSRSKSRKKKKKGKSKGKRRRKSSSSSSSSSSSPSRGRKNKKSVAVIDLS